MSAVCLTQITFGAAGTPGDMAVKDGYMVIKSVIKSFVTSVTAPQGFVTLVHNKALSIEVIASESKLGVFTRSGNHVAYFMADDQESFRDIIRRVKHRADDRIREANQSTNDELEPELKAIKMNLKSCDADILVGREHSVIAITNTELSDCALLPPPPCGWSHELIAMALNCKTARSFRANWEAVDVCIIETTDSGPERHWIGSTESF